METVWLLTNQWLRWERFEQQFAALGAAAAATGRLRLQRVSNDWVAAHATQLSRSALPAAVLVMDKDLPVLRLLEARGVRLINSAQAVADCDDKLYTFASLAGAGVAQPDTLAVPLHYQPLTREQWRSSEFSRQVREFLGFPLVLKHAVGSWGQGVFLLHSEEELLDHLAAAQGQRLLVQRYTASSHGQDTRLYMVGRRCVAAMERRGVGGDFRTNVTGGGTAVSATPSDGQLQAARTAMKALGLEIGSVDFLGELVCEVNSNAQFMTLMEVTGCDVAAQVIDYVARQVAR
ncbi:RimK family alpha-L-glutamate ligase [Corynebacterium lizhenjunii]|uniref:RimK family alpha-L-glutamate ligase n=1 Tax=Corynebacterium lizhenjunii TaxID=2709394 RepID=A0A7T0PA65_9CORY|nr:RimK family alpha-L-glutamate ligase [Corynebacterium lizhenjunii]QPK78661.1 RimK family alpha-L-glutamate ligase [Corynebacterium lizhenjunii]